MPRKARKSKTNVTRITGNILDCHKLQTDCKRNLSIVAGLRTSTVLLLDANPTQPNPELRMYSTSLCPKPVVHPFESSRELKHPCEKLIPAFQTVPFHLLALPTVLNLVPLHPQFYQLAFFTPGIFPAKAFTRKLYWKGNLRQLWSPPYIPIHDFQHSNGHILSSS
jgi:hypothetical protein